MKQVIKILITLILLLLLHTTIKVVTVQASFIDDLKNILKINSTEQDSEYNDNIDTSILLPHTEIIDSPNIEDIKLNLEKKSDDNLIVVQSNPTISEPTTDNVNRFYYNQLTSNISKKIYNTLITATTNKATINLNVQYSVNENSYNAADKCFEEKIVPYIYDALYAYGEDSGNYWWQGGIPNLQYTYTRGVSNKVATFGTVTLISNLTQYTNSTLFNKKLVQASNSITGNNIYEIVDSINTYICNNVQYARKSDGTSPDTGGINQTAYGALINGKCVCEGYAQLFNLMCRQKGLISICVYGYSADTNGGKAGHAWNYVYDPSKRLWFAVDCTYNKDNNNNYYLMVGENTRIESTEFKITHLPGLKICNKQTYTPSVPTLYTEKYLVFAPSIQTTQSEGNFTIKINSNIDLKNHDFWILSNDKKTLSRSYYSKTTVTDTISNIYDETMSYDIKINNIDKTAQVFATNNYKIKNGIITTIQPNVTFDDFTKNINANMNYIVKEKDKKVVGKDKMKTGQTLIMGEKNYAIAISGDTNGDGQADIKDILNINKHRLGKVQLTNEYFIAGDVNQDQRVDIKDILQINKYRLGKK